MGKILFSFGFNFNYSYMANPFGNCNSFMPMTPCSSPLNSIFGLNQSNYSQYNQSFMFSNNTEQYPSLYDSLGISAPNFQYNNFNNPFTQTPIPQNFSNMYNPMDFMNDLFESLRPSNINTNYSSSHTNNSSRSDFNTKTNLPQFKDIAYNKEQGKNLAAIVSQNTRSKSQGLCAKYTKLAIQNAGLGPYIQGHGYQCADILRSNSNFKEIKVKGKDLSKLPAGCVIVYDRGDAGYSSSYGHVEITLGNGKAASDFTNKKIKKSDRTSVFVPV